ncbi:WecB/TagA/CpsF family glycosyltransferase [Brucella sp. IR073]|uniref:WecB/TagA/CpsF family glycosyltransferase n=1 Tax=unclassified Brucella TaxID=2632610 RepID=UPI003B9804A8
MQFETMKRFPQDIFGLRFTNAGAEALVEHLIRAPQPLKGGARMFFTANLDHIVQMRGNPAFREAYDRAAIVTADGTPVFLYARWRGVALPGRVTGADLFPALMARLDPARHRPFFVLSDEETAARLAEKLGSQGFGQVETEIPPFGFEEDEAYSSALARRIADAGTTHLFFCVGAPKSELWLDRHRHRIGPCFALAFGASPNFYVGTVQRAPQLMRSIGAEWLWRFLCEPRRLFRRYFIDGWKFLGAIADDLRRKSP